MKNTAKNRIRQSNLIENIDDPAEDARSLEAWEWLETQNFISSGRLLELHHLITFAQLPQDQSGQFRQVNVMVGYDFPPPPNIARYQIADWIADLRKNYKKLDPKEMHIRFEDIHPFIDGNGRIGRMLMWWHQIRLGQEPVLLRADRREDYFDWLRYTPIKVESKKLP